MMPVVRGLLLAAIATSLLWPDIAVARHAGKHPSITVRPKYPAKHRWRGYGFLPGYRQPPNLTDWRDRSVRHRGRREPYELRYWHNGQIEYGFGYPGFYRGRWNGGSFGPCWTSTPIGMMWNCGQ